MDDRVKYHLIGAMRVYQDGRRLFSYHRIEADTIAILSPPALVRLPEDEFIGNAFAIFKF
jgi:hypothetical protein